MLDISDKIRAYERLYGFAFKNNLTIESEISRIERELVASGIPKEEMDVIQGRVLEKVDADLLKKKREDGSESNIQDYDMSTLPDATEVFYPISPEAILSTIRFFFRSSEKILSEPALVPLRDSIAILAIKRAVTELVGHELTKDQYDCLMRAIHEVYLRTKARMK